MVARIAPVRIGAPTCFDDRWTGRVTGIDVQDDWTVLNVTVTAGFIALKSVKLPFSSATSWSDAAVRIAATNTQAFAREIPPVAAPATALTGKTGTSHQGTRFAGLLVRTADRRAEEVILSRGGKLYRIPAAQVKLEGETLTLGVAPESLAPYEADADILQRLHEAILGDQTLMPDDKLYLKTEVEHGEAVLSGNVHVDVTKDHIEAISRKVQGVIGVRNELRHDFEIEVDIGRALERAGLYQDARIAVRSSLGHVTLVGTAPSERAIEDIVRTAAKVPGARQVKSQLRVQSLSLIR